jgi:hypothetical protein
MIQPTVIEIHAAPAGQHADGLDEDVIEAFTQDRALYACACGAGFQADVSVSVQCPGCGAEQAW